MQAGYQLILSRISSRHELTTTVSVVHREWVSPAVVTYMMNELLENDAAHPDLTQVAANPDLTQESAYPESAGISSL